MNPVAEALCEMRMSEMTTVFDAQLFAPTGEYDNPAMIEGVFAKLWPRMRNAEEVHHYLQDFTQGNIYRQELACVVADEPIYSKPEEHEAPARGQESAYSDYHYQFIRYPLYNQQGQWGANALQVCDITERVRDERNRSALLSSVSHDLRTPLTTIKAAVTGLLQTDVDWDEQDRREMLEDIDIETDHLTVLVNALVELSRIQMGALSLEKEWCDIIEVVHGALAKMERALAGRPIRTSFQTSLPLIYVDHVQLERVFYNLIENAVRHSPQHSEIILTIEAIGETLHVRVIDRGSVALEPERKSSFRSFYHTGSYRDGLELAICTGIIEAHQGHVSVETAAGGGSCFVFTLPIHPQTMGRREPKGMPSSQDVVDGEVTSSQQA
ncbi:hypothetical protein EPA93_42990 [Ktedonosporobacter rubrisoli]|uniref:histidine kinase n=1 Tax=Ktedonosporobacter rubrisoli TaxID=2509675 RepID=A0A4P6K364_KTERU|nr:ATP-binding protein [Ktedonosporobacter rubrisoli]QBD82382.1 hypothetical protein EPA93_42990 [Ktedonosporobacter rubrisoli]